MEDHINQWKKSSRTDIAQSIEKLKRAGEPITIMFLMLKPSLYENIKDHSIAELKKVTAELQLDTSSCQNKSDYIKKVCSAYQQPESSGSDSDY
eukprot:TRINITY_DN1927_c0_g1_i1.p1 TRINITY_DN1927_c0_g1~~TRINITY_DN1927_c0_g1_i1.p1  ORF type:complete len:94 (-),score=18.79 TRINITY_DN1927_c0_g1_i1:10-291(-)